MPRKPNYPITPLPPDMPAETVRELFAQNLQRALNEKGWIQSDLSRKADVGRDNISKYLRGKSPTRLQFRCGLAARRTGLGYRACGLTAQKAPYVFFLIAR